MIYIHKIDAEGFDWDAFNVGHIARHGLRPEDAERALSNESTAVYEGLTKAGERRWVSVGRLDSGRLVAVVWTVRGSRVRVVTAYPAGERLRRTYEEARSDDSGSAHKAAPLVQD
jgi:uncharacterized DUF497 family protein